MRINIKTVFIMLHSGLLLLASCGKEPLSTEDNTISNAQLKVEIFDSDSCVNNAIKYVKDIYDNQKLTFNRDFRKDFQYCLGDYVPKIWDIVEVKGEIQIITSVPEYSKILNLKTWTFQLSKADCPIGEIESVGEWRVSDGIHLTDGHTPSKYWRN
jgi:hypothetical protein